MKLDYFAELFVAGRFAAAGWNVYFPHRDEGFDFIVTKSTAGNTELIRPVQVKGKYPTEAKTNKAVYGYVGKLTQVHPEMVLALPYFSSNSSNGVPACVAYMPFSQIKPHSRGYRCEPASYSNASPVPRKEYRKFFDTAGLALVESPSWRSIHIQNGAALAPIKPPRR